MKSIPSNSNFYQNWKSVLDPLAFAAVSFGLFKTCHTFKWFRGPFHLLHHELVFSPLLRADQIRNGMLFEAAINGVALGVLHQVSKEDDFDSFFYKAAVTTLGLGFGSTGAYLAVGTCIKSQMLVLTPALATITATAHLAIKLLLNGVFQPSDQKKIETTPWEKQTFKEQLGYNQAKQAEGQPLKRMTNFNFDGYLTEPELETFNAVCELGPLVSEQTNLLYRFNQPPKRVYQKEELPLLNLKLSVLLINKLSHPQLYWYHLFFKAFPKLHIEREQIAAFKQRFLELGLEMPSAQFNDSPQKQNKDRNPLVVTVACGALLALGSYFAYRQQMEPSMPPLTQPQATNFCYLNETISAHLADSYPWLQKKEELQFPNITSSVKPTQTPKKDLITPYFLQAMQADTAPQSFVKPAEVKRPSKTPPSTPAVPVSMGPCLPKGFGEKPVGNHSYSNEVVSLEQPNRKFTPFQTVLTLVTGCALSALAILARCMRKRPVKTVEDVKPVKKATHTNGVLKVEIKEEKPKTIRELLEKLKTLEGNAVEAAMIAYFGKERNTITNVNHFANSEISNAVINKICPCLKTVFPKMQTLDLSKCSCLRFAPRNEESKLECLFGLEGVHLVLANCSDICEPLPRGGVRTRGRRKSNGQNSREIGQHKVLLDTVKAVESSIKVSVLDLSGSITLEPGGVSLNNSQFRQGKAAGWGNITQKDQQVVEILETWIENGPLTSVCYSQFIREKEAHQGEIGKIELTTLKKEIKEEPAD